MTHHKTDVLIIGAGPSGAVAAAIADKKGLLYVYCISIVDMSKPLLSNFTVPFYPRIYMLPY